MRPMHVAVWSEAAQPSRTSEFLNSLPPDALRELQATVLPACSPAKAVLFQEGQECTGILILLDGYAKISMNSSDGRRLILWFARPPELLGLTSVLAGSCHEVTAETLYPCRVAWIPRRAFLDFLNRHPGVYQSAVGELRLELSRAREQMRILGLSSSAAVKLARLLLEWSAGGQMIQQGTCVSVSLTHEEMGECIGATRETVSRAMADFRQRHLIDMFGSILIIPNRFALEAYAQVLQRTGLSAAQFRADRVRHSAKAGTRSEAEMETRSRIHLEVNRGGKARRPAAGVSTD